VRIRKKHLIRLGLAVTAGLTAILAVFVFVCPEAPLDIAGSLKNHNLVVIVIDALRADHLGCYGYHRDTSPFIDSLADGGMVFQRALSNSSFTRESVSVLFSGRLPSSSGSVGWFSAPSGKNDNLAGLFQRAGYATALLSNSPQVKHPNFQTGFDHVELLHSQWGSRGDSGGGPRLSGRALAFARKNTDRKFMMYLHYLDPHGPYNPPPEFMQRFRSEEFPHPVSLYNTVRWHCHRLMQEGFGPGEARFEDMVLRYDAEIALVDHSIQLLVQGLQKLGLDRNTLLVVTADHGEEFLEHDFVAHAWTLYNESLHVPLIVWAPGMVVPRRVASRVSLVDLLPTLLTIMDIPHGRDDFDGTRLFQTRRNGFAFTAPQKPFIAELQIQHRNLLRAVILDQRKYIRARRWLPPDERPGVFSTKGRTIEYNTDRHLNIWGPVVHEEWYDLSTDPRERRMLAVDERSRELARILNQYEKATRGRGMPPNRPGMKKRTLSKKEKAKLKTLGYL